MKALVLLPLLSIAAVSADMRVGIIGTDTSHVLAFVKILNDAANADHAPGAKIVAAYKGGSEDVESSRTRVDGYAEELRTKWNVEIVPDIATLAGKVDAVLLESVDGRKHLPQFKELVKAGRKVPVFIDKPLASTLEDAREIARLAKQHGIPWFSSSSLRWSNAAMLDAKGASAVSTWGPGPTEEHHYLDLSWYGVHPIEMLYTLLGPGCQEVTRTSGKDADTTTCRWSDGRVGTVTTLRPYGDYGAVVMKGKQVLQSEKLKVNYAPMLAEIVKFFQTGKAPVPEETTLELFAFMDAAQRSKEQGGKPTRLR